MEATLVRALPKGDDWLFEPKWDGFRCLAFKDGESVALQSKAGQPLARYFPDVVEAVASLAVRRCVLDGELVVPVPGGFEFEPLLARMHPAASRVRTLVREAPAALLAFDLLVNERGHPLLDAPLSARRRALEAFAAKHLRGSRIGLSLATRDVAEAGRWLAGARPGIDGVIAKRLGDRYESGERAMEKVKLSRSADCVVGGIRWAAGGGASARRREIGSLLLGLYRRDGLLHYVGHAASFDAETRHALTTLFLPLVNGAGFSGEPPGPNRWSRGHSADWVPVRPDRVVEVEYHHASGGRFRHGTRFLRTRPDKRPDDCRFEQLLLPGSPARGTQGRRQPLG